MDYFDILLKFAGGFGLFIYGMHIMASGLQKTAGNKMKQLLEVLTKNRLLAVLVGTLVTAIIQSSSATTVMVVGFVNAGIMNLSQSVGVIMGANVGTTVTAWLVSLLELSSVEDASAILKIFNPSTFAPIATAIGAILVLFIKKKTINNAGEIIVGLGVLFIGMSTMSVSLKPLSESEVFRNAFQTMGTNPFLGLLAGAAVTGIIQSSSASVGILQSLAMTGLVPWGAAVYIIMGQNIGTCVTAILSSIGTTKNAKAAALTHLLFNVVGSVIFTIVALIFFRFINPDFGKTLITATYIGVVHTMFNIANTTLLFPFADKLVALAEKITRVSKTPPDESETVHLDDRVLETPVFALQSCLKEIVRLGDLAAENLDTASQALFDRDTEKIEKVMKREKNIDSLSKSITQYLVKICNADINEDENAFITSMFYVVNDIERVGDHSENIAEMASLSIEENAVFSEIAKEHFDEMIKYTRECFELSIKALQKDDKKLARGVIPLEQKVDELEEKFREEHIRRLANNDCNTTAGVIFIDMLTNLERISDHALNIAQVVLNERIPNKMDDKATKNNKPHPANR